MHLLSREHLVKTLMECGYTIQEFMVSPTSVRNTHWNINCITCLCDLGFIQSKFYLTFFFINPVWDPKFKTALLPDCEEINGKGKACCSDPGIMKCVKESLHY